MSNRETRALELSALERHHAKDLQPYFEALAGDPEDKALAEMLSSLLSDRVIYLLRRGSRLELVDESVAMASFLESDAGKLLRECRSSLHAAWCGFEELLSEAADRSDRDAVDSILLSHRGRGQKVLEFLAEQPKAVRRAELRQVLGEEISDSLVSHLLRDLEEADLIVRFRARKSKEVLVELGVVGRDVVRREVCPAWVSYLGEQIIKLQQTGSISFREVHENLIKIGAPSELTARKLAEALAGPMPSLPTRAGEGASPLKIGNLPEVVVDKMLNESALVVGEFVVSCEGITSKTSGGEAIKEIVDGAHTFYRSASRFCESSIEFNPNWSRGFLKGLLEKAGKFSQLERTLWDSFKRLVQFAPGLAQVHHDEFHFLKAFVTQAHAKYDLDIQRLRRQLREALGHQKVSGVVVGLVDSFIDADELDRFAVFLSLMEWAGHSFVITMLFQRGDKPSRLAKSLWLYSDCILMESRYSSANSEEDTALDLLRALSVRADTSPYLKVLWAALAEEDLSEELFRSKFGSLGINPENADLHVLWRAVIAYHERISVRRRAAAQAPLSALWPLLVYHRVSMESLRAVAQQVEEEDERHLKRIFFCCIRPRLSEFLEKSTHEHQKDGVVGDIIKALFSFDFLSETSYLKDFERLLALYRIRSGSLGQGVAPFEEELGALRRRKKRGTGESKKLTRNVEILSLPVQLHLARNGSFVNILACHQDPRVATETVRYILDNRGVDRLMRYCRQNRRVPSKSVLGRLQKSHRERLLSGLVKSSGRIRDTALESALKRQLSSRDLDWLNNRKNSL